MIVSISVKGTHTHFFSSCFTCHCQCVLLGKIAPQTASAAFSSPTFTPATFSLAVINCLEPLAIAMRRTAPNPLGAGVANFGTEIVVGEVRLAEDSSAQPEHSLRQAFEIHLVEYGLENLAPRQL